MSMSTDVYGFKPPNEKWKKMKAVYDACDAAGTKVPKEVDNFFEDEPPDDAGVSVKIVGTDCCKEYDEDMREGYEIDITKLPKDVTVLRFVNSY